MHDRAVVIHAKGRAAEGLGESSAAREDLGDNFALQLLCISAQVGVGHKRRQV